MVTEKQKTLDGQWAYGYYIVRSDESPVVETTSSYDQHLICTHDFNGLDECEVDPETIGQFTGLLDKNNKEIYEGDIIYSFHHAPSFKIGFIEGAFCATHSIDEFALDINHFYSSKGCCIEVIGNIHDNPELLTKE